MEKYDIYPNKANLISSIEKNVTGRNNSIYYLLRFLNSQDDSWSIAINCSWGSGKTFFVKQCKLMIDSLNVTKSDEQIDPKLTTALNILCNKNSNNQEAISQRPFRTAYYDAWAHDSDTDPIISILQCLSNSLRGAKAREQLNNALKLGMAILNATTWVDLSTLQDLIESKNNDLEALKEKFNSTLSKLAPAHGKLLIFVDELDRCKPTYAVKLLERIKHYFSNQNVSFIFSVDLDQLQHTIKHYYGSNFAGYEYLDRFFDLVINLPEPDMDKYFANTKDILKVAELFNNDTHNYYQDFCGELINHFSFSLRQLNHFYLKSNSSSYNLIARSLQGEWSSDNGLFIIYTFLLPLMNALNQANAHEFNRFIAGKASDDTLNILTNSKNFSRYYTDISDDKAHVDVSQGARQIYNAIFGPDTNRSLIISRQCIIDNPKICREILIDACNLLSSTSKLD